MKKRFLGMMFVAGMVSSSAVAQEQVYQFLQVGATDAQKLSQAYLQPYGEMLGVGLNSGWYNSAGVHKVLGFDLMLSGTYTMAPSSVKTFDINSLGLVNTSVVPGQSSIAPTVSGKGDMPDLRYDADGNGVIPAQTISDLPSGAGMSSMFTPMIQASVGLPFRTEIMGRYMPKVEYDYIGKASMWGLGIKHDLTEYIPFVKRVPFLKLSVMAAYTDFSGSTDIPDVKNMVSNGSFDVNSSAFTSRLLVGVQVPVVSFFAGAGYGSTNSDFGLKGTYNVAGTMQQDPLAFNYTTDGFDFNAGMRLRFGIFAIYGDYTVGKYSSTTFGLGLNFR